MSRIAVLSFILGMGLVSLSGLLNPGYGPIDSLWPALLGYSFVIYNYARIQAKNHADKIKRGEWITHWKVNIIRFIVLAGIPFFYHAYYFHITKIIQLFLFGLPCFGLIFNLNLNKFRGLKWDYVGINDKKDALQDKIMSKIPHGGKILFGIEVILAILFCYLYIFK